MTLCSNFCLGWVAFSAASSLTISCLPPPCTGDEDGDEEHRALMAAWFASLGAAALEAEHRRRSNGGAAAAATGDASRSSSSGGGGCTVLLSLCNDQFSRWRVEAAARAAFFFLAGVGVCVGACVVGWGAGAGMGGAALSAGHAMLSCPCNPLHFNPLHSHCGARRPHALPGLGLPRLHAQAGALRRRLSPRPSLHIHAHLPPSSAALRCVLHLMSSS